MFTGIVETTGVVTSVDDVDGGRHLQIEAPDIASTMSVGDSVAVQGACLTATAITERGFSLDLVSETLRRTSLGAITSGARVNLERAMPASGRFDGHIVQGHVDGVGTVQAISREGEGSRLSIAVGDGLMRYIVEKGSITIDGVSLTVAQVDATGFEIALIPHTLAVTTLGALEVSAPVNLEVDILAKYVERLMETRN
jgi:riboflavin synthase